ncbi:hypothetical protein KFK09_002077 [Dendrobium nobile]|uniref:DYW domain-containing protein n=1 Tax=Dendrobium nobile TaxID=94219 RepID=A0A8T3CCS0_DENNO|nr:hypothetical protein KFK09_002077 [Dendrobium nobile]
MKWVLHDIEEEDKRGSLRCHSEKLALALGLMKTVEEIRIVKNLRMVSVPVEIIGELNTESGAQIGQSTRSCSSNCKQIKMIKNQPLYAHGVFTCLCEAKLLRAITERHPEANRVWLTRNQAQLLNELFLWTSTLAAGEMMMVALKLADNASTTAAVKITVRGSAGVDLGSVGRALGLEPSTVRLNGHFISRGTDLISSLSWKSVLSFFAARGLPAGGSLLDSIVVQGKPTANTGWHSSSDIDHVGHIGFKRKGTLKDEKPGKKNRFLEGQPKEQNIGTKLLANDKCLCIKRQLKLVDHQPSKKGKIGECCSDCHSSSNMKNADRLHVKGSESIADDEKIPRKNQFLEGTTLDQNFGSEQETDDTDFLNCIKKRLKLDDDHPTKKGKIDERNSGLPDEASKLPVETGFNCSFINVFGKRLREDGMAPSVFCEKIK